MSKTNYQEDFEDLLIFIDALDKDIGIPSFDWDAKFYTGQYHGRNYHIRRQDGTYVNAYEEDGHIVAIFKNHGLGPGRLHCELTIFLPDADYPDGIKKTRARLLTDRELTPDPTPLPTRLELQAILPTIKGEAFEYDDFTPEQIEGLRKPAKDAADEAKTLMETFSADERQRKIDENSRRMNENLREGAEKKRVDADEKRQIFYSQAKKAEGAREEAETERVKAAKAAADAEVQRQADDKKRQTKDAEYAAAETKRATDFDSAQTKRATDFNSAQAQRAADFTAAQQNRETTFNQSEADRTSTFNASQTARTNDFNAAQAQRQTDFETAEAARQQTFSTKEQERAAEFATYEATINAKQDALTVSDDLKLTEDAHLSLSDTLKADLEQMQSDIDMAVGASMGAYCVGEWNPDNLAPEAVAIHGNREWLRELYWWLIDTTDNAGPVTHPVGMLNKKNLLRFTDGRFAPTVGITEAQRAECDVALYLDAEHTQQYCEAGAFDAEAFYNEHGMAKLYDAEGNEVRVLRPWETTETKYTIGVSYKDTVYLLDNVKGKSGKTWKGIFSKPVMWDGIDVGKFPLAPTAIAPCPVTTIGGKTRNFFYAYQGGDSGTKSGKGQNNLCDMFANDRTYPRVGDMHQINNMNWARANNADPDSPIPFAEGGYHALNTYLSALELIYGTKAIHHPSLFGSGISSDESCNNETHFRDYGGVRYKVGDATEWSYQYMAGTPTFCINNEGGKTFWSNILNYEYPKEQCMESQMAMSFAEETDVAEGVEFEFYGATYYYKRVPNASTDAMNVRVYKIMPATFNAFNTEGDSVVVTCEACLRMSLFEGLNIVGDIFAYWGGGYEQVGHVTHNPATSRVGFPVDLYLQPDQTKWIKIPERITVDVPGPWGLRKAYIFIGSYVNISNNSSRLRIPYGATSIVAGGGVFSGECFYSWSLNYWAVDGEGEIGKVVRIAARFRGYASSGASSPRFLSANFSVTFGARYYGGSAQVLVDTTMAQGAQPQPQALAA